MYFLKRPWNWSKISNKIYQNTSLELEGFKENLIKNIFPLNFFTSSTRKIFIERASKTLKLSFTKFPLKNFIPSTC